MRAVPVEQHVLCVRPGGNCGAQGSLEAASPEDDETRLWEALADGAEDLDLQPQVVLRLEQPDRQEQRSV